jgi:hypothetical protein
MTISLENCREETLMKNLLVDHLKELQKELEACGNYHYQIQTLFCEGYYTTLNLIQKVYGKNWNLILKHVQPGVWSL